MDLEDVGQFHVRHMHRIVPLYCKNILYSPMDVIMDALEAWFGSNCVSICVQLVVFKAVKPHSC